MALNSSSVTFVFQRPSRAGSSRRAIAKICWVLSTSAESVPGPCFACLCCLVLVGRSGVIRFSSRCCAVLLWTVLLHAAVCAERRRGALLMAEISGGDRVGPAVSHLVQGTAGHAKKRRRSIGKKNVMLREILPVVQGHSCLTADCEGDCRR